MKRLFNAFWNFIIRKWFLYSLSFFIFIILLYIAIKHGYHSNWTGFRGSIIQTVPNQTIQPAKTLWDWLELLIIPLALVIGGYLLNRSEKRHEIKLSKEKAEKDRLNAENLNQETALNDYFDRMSDLLLNFQLKESPMNSVERDVARTRTLTVLHRLNGERKANVLNFLAESKLIQNGLPPIINLGNANFKNLKISNGLLRNIYLLSVDFRDSNFWGTDFSNSCLEGCDFLASSGEHAKFIGARLIHTRLAKCILDRADFSNASLFNVSFFESSFQFAKFTNTEMEGADFYMANLENALLEGADMVGIKYLSQSQLDSAYYIEKPPALSPKYKSPPKIDENKYYMKLKAYMRTKTSYMIDLNELDKFLTYI